MKCHFQMSTWSCYKVLELVRQFHIKKQVDLTERSTSKVPRRYVADASNARLRYVARYCVAALRKRYTKLQKSHLYSTSNEGQDLYYTLGGLNAFTVTKGCTTTVSLVVVILSGNRRISWKCWWFQWGKAGNTLISWWCVQRRFIKYLKNSVRNTNKCF